MQEMDFNLDNKVWVLVADGEKALFFENVGNRKTPDFKVVKELAQNNPATREQGTDSPGRRSDNGVGQKSAMEETDWHRLAEDRFAKDAAELLYKYAHRNRFREIVLCAAPRILGELRKELHAEVSAKVIGEVPKNLTNHPVDQIERILSAG
ncbi:host attachment family protein [Pelagibacterium sp. 26DY04]|uniref:host attachment family protein n=1 Tax=unclassified Pelagibacterium TaxID=2623280 RepID=UPI002814E0AE|nr:MULTISPECIES: host attachment family protein [unclassified Pelagibacterium]WMT88796.1 host attachment family protein [Pelagibacterium sp. 26DY04]WMT90546.1 host attachment family protein [Pelagibacterium sp. H642]